MDPICRNNVSITGNLGAERAMLFVHGFGTDRRAWQAVAASFATDFKIILLDNVGAGQSDPAAFVQHRYLNLERYAQDLCEVCRALKLTQLVVVGHSAGAMIALLAALSAPECFSKVVLIGASPRYLDEADYRGGFTRKDIDTLYESIMSGGGAWVDSFAPAMIGNPDRPHLATHFADSIKTIPTDRVLTVLCSILQSDYRSEVCKLSKPTLIIQSAHDNAVPLEVAEYLQQKIPDSRLAVIDADGHLPHISDPDKVVAAMTAFVYQ